MRDYVIIFRIDFSIVISISKLKLQFTICVSPIL